MLNTYVNFAFFLALHVQPFCETFVSLCISHFKAAVSILHDFFSQGTLSMRACHHCLGV